MKNIFEIPRNAKIAIVVIIDAALHFISTWLAYTLRWEKIHIPSTNLEYLVFFVPVVFLLFIFSYFKLYKSLFRYLDLNASIGILKALAIYFIFYAIFIFTLNANYSFFTPNPLFPGMPRIIVIIYPLFLFLFIIGSRFLISYIFFLFKNYKSKDINLKKVLIYGAGNFGARYLGILRNTFRYEIRGFLDDDKKLNQKFLNGVKIFDLKNIDQLINDLQIDEVFLAINNIGRKKKIDIKNKFQSLNVKLRFVPDLDDLLQEDTSIIPTSQPDILDLLKRRQINPNQNLIKKNIFDKVVFVSGAGGSIGSELCNQIIKQIPKKLIILDHSEFSIHQINEKLNIFIKKNNLKTNLIPVLGNLLDKNLIKKIFNEYKVDTIYHAAAYKHVSLVEENPVSSVKNNVIGTLNLTKEAKINNVKTFVLISSDKAINPTNIMGASKRLCEMIVQAFSIKNINGINKEQNFCSVRFGNVLNSSGSVVPIFSKQISSGGPVTVRHKNVSRYFMTIPEASELVIQAGALSSGGEIFILDMGKAIKIYELATHMIELSGLTVKNATNPYGDIEILITKLKDGEKLEEELPNKLIMQKTLHERINKTSEEFIDEKNIETIINNLISLFDQNDKIGLINLFKKYIKGYKPEPYKK
ncbi:MAG: hypothetical protein CBC24_03430 [Candidatus Pelagibacter sp. TMED64]|nr:hypothetical protein [Candidatus Pelagibacter sp.]OUU66394.1 MAG: hypothetical protein CBC24_03430 [Candidatus Pelagibacter sp. TMED64]